jgi:hypothetical protein
MTSAPLAGEDLPSENPFPNKYLYNEFAGFAGERLLKSIVRLILTRAHLHIWETFTERQAPGNDAYLSFASAAKALAREPRTVNAGVQGLQARKLLILRIEQKVLRQADGSYKRKYVVAKDFGGLYALAHDYWLWTQDEAYIEPSREFAELLQQLEDDEPLKKKLLRYENYRRIIQDQIPGRKPHKCGVHPYFADFNPDHMGEELPPAQPSEEVSVEDAEEDKKSQHLSLITQINASINAQKIAEERTRENDQSNLLKGDSNDSEDHFESGGDGYTKAKLVIEPEQVRGTTQPTPNPNIPKSSTPTIGKTGAAGRSAERGQTPEQQKVAAWSRGKGKRGKYQGDGKPRPAANSLISAYVWEFARVLGDLSPRSSETTLLRLVEENHLSRSGDVLACLVRAHLKAMPLTPRDHDPITGVPLKMKIVNNFFRDFASTYSEWGTGYSNDRLAEDLKKDERFHQFYEEYRAKLAREQAQTAPLADESGGEKAENQVQEQETAEQGEENRDQGGGLQLFVEDLRIAAPASWMDQTQAEALLQTIYKELPTIDGGMRLMEAVIYRRCRSLRRAGSGSVLHLEVEFVNEAGVKFNLPLDFADEGQWLEYYEDQRRGLLK